MAPSKITRLPSPPDQHLLARLAADDAHAFDEIFRAWYAPLVRFAARLIGDRARAEEIAQDVFLSLWQQRAVLHAHTSPQAWLFRATRNRALNVVRHDRVVTRAEGALSTTLPAGEHDSTLAVDDAVAEAEMHAAIAAVVATLPPRCRQVFLLSRMQGLPHAQIGTQLGIGQKAVEAHITRAMRQLRAALAPWLVR